MHQREKYQPVCILMNNEGNRKQNKKLNDAYVQNLEKKNGIDSLNHWLAFLMHATTCFECLSAMKHLPK